MKLRGARFSYDCRPKRKTNNTCRRSFAFKRRLGAVETFESIVREWAGMEGVSVVRECDLRNRSAGDTARSADGHRATARLALALSLSAFRMARMPGRRLISGGCGQSKRLLDPYSTVVVLFKRIIGLRVQQVPIWQRRSCSKRGTWFPASSALIIIHLIISQLDRISSTNYYHQRYRHLTS